MADMDVMVDGKAFFLYDLGELSPQRLFCEYRRAFMEKGFDKKG
jgi:hypothetical protein